MYHFESSEESLIQVGVTASKKHFKKAVTRNRIKRLLREAYRLQKIGFLETARQHHKKGYVFFMYTDKTVASFDVIAEAMRKCLLQLEQKLAINEEPS